MPRFIPEPTVVPAAGNMRKEIREYVGRINTGTSAVSVARMKSPAGWIEPGQRPEFEEITLVLDGVVRVEYEGGVVDVGAGQAIHTLPGEWVRYSTPEDGGAQYVAICIPGFSPDAVHRDEQ